MGGGIILTSKFPSRNDTFVSGIGFVSQNALVSLFANNTAPTSQQAYVMGLGLNVGDVVTNVHVSVNTAGAGTAPTAIYGGLATQDGVMLGSSANLKDDAQWTSGGFKTMPLASPVTITASGVYMVVFLQNGTWGSTQMTLHRASNNLNKFGSLRWYGSEASKTSLPADGASLTLTDTFHAYWAGVS